ncbi:hypothetical protein BV25DRAFT_1838919 [Artomyces pyxidatus]|uniref:Uncharacterized protein n=1 Tax=Artomyces pyxidatus TaxID=48021 RepID=A0ACB8SYY1_9AGAM|nr:hypothetical protein BV25DRAFT_1838919 [Artomyces pyxidatus]
MIMCERPMLVCPQNIPSRCAEFIVKELRSLYDEQFFPLHNCHSSEPEDFEGSPATLSNTLQIYPILSRVNHSCVPNAVYRWDLDHFSGEVRATRPINEDEEVTASQTPLSEVSIEDPAEQLDGDMGMSADGFGEGFRRDR